MADRTVVPEGAVEAGARALFIQEPQSLAWEDESEECRQRYRFRAHTVLSAAEVRGVYQAIEVGWALHLAEKNWYGLPSWLRDEYERGGVVFAASEVFIHGAHANRGDWIIQGDNGGIPRIASAALASGALVPAEEHAAAVEALRHAMGAHQLAGRRTCPRCEEIRDTFLASRVEPPKETQG